MGKVRRAPMARAVYAGGNFMRKISKIWKDKNAISQPIELRNPTFFCVHVGSLRAWLLGRAYDCLKH